MTDNLRKLIAAISFLAALLVAGAVQAVPISQLVVFGDSLADSGNNAVFFDAFVAPPGTPPGTLRTATPIPAPNFIPTYPYASNRYSNGPVWVEQLASRLGLSAQPSLLGGTNYAFGGARTGPVESSFPFSLRDQVAMFLGATGGIAPSSALYVVEGGGNDARDAFAIAAGGGDPTPLIAAYAANMASILVELGAAGADHILLANVPDIGKTPAIQSFGVAAAAGATALAVAMNAALDATLAALSPSITDGLRFLDLFSLLDEVFADPAAFGLSDATSACAFSPACIADPAGTFFWDGIHPTAAGYAVLAAEALALIPEPTSLTLLAAALLAIIALGSRRKAS